MEDLQALAARAVEFGFSHAAPLNAATLKPREEVRGMCAADKCRSYGKTWRCPPGCSTLEENIAIAAGYTAGLLVQTTAQLEDDFDYEGMSAAGQLQKRRMLALRDALLAEYPRVLALGNGGCDLCETCTYPDAPCRKPGLALESMEAFGLLVSETCADNGLGYYYGPGTITYTGCYLLY